MPDSMQLLSFDNLAQRVLYRYAFTFADFVPMESDAVSVGAQQALYNLFGSIIRGFADDPALLGLSTIHPDEWLGAHQVMNRHPELYKVRNGCLKAFNDLSGFLYTVGLYGEFHSGQLAVHKDKTYKITGKMMTVYQDLFGRFGLSVNAGSDMISFAFPEYPEALSAWRLLAAVCGEYPDRQ